MPVGATSRSLLSARAFLFLQLTGSAPRHWSKPATRSSLFDAGRGATIRLWQLKIPFSKVSPLFLTHFHSDHTVGIPDLWLTGWLGGPFGRRSTPFHVIGPAGTKDLMLNLERAYEGDIRVRTADEHYPPEGVKVVADEFPAEGVVYDKEGVRVTAFEVDHGDVIKPAYGYRIDYKGRSVVLSGDTASAITSSSTEPGRTSSFTKSLRSGPNC
jgi:ribonuclease BN (tRNA processing enzyme)